MSHVESIDNVVIKDLKSLRESAEEHGCVWLEGKKEYAWWGSHVGDYPLPKGMTKEMLGKCDHVIKVPGVTYEIGVVNVGEGKYTLAYDFYGNGKGLLEKFGKGLKTLCHTYSVKAALAAARRKGYTATAIKQQNGTTQVKISVT